MIKSFKCRYTLELWRTGKNKRLPSEVIKSALRKLAMIDSAFEIRDLKIPPNNKLEPLKGDREGQYSIRVNQQWRICFIWEQHDAFDVEIVDYP